MGVPACDSIVTCHVSELLERLGLREGTDFSICSANQLLTDAGELNESLLQDCNLIVVGGPKGNPVTAELVSRMEKDKSRYRYVFRSDGNGGYHIEDQWNGAPFTAMSPCNGQSTSKIGRDFGLITLTRSPFSGAQEHYVTVLAGVHGTGTLALGRVLYHYIARVMRTDGRADPFQAVIKAEYESDWENLIRVSSATSMEVFWTGSVHAS